MIYKQEQMASGPQYQNLKQARARLFARFTNQKDPQLEKFRALKVQTAFKGGLRTTAGETEDWRIPFSDTLPDAVFKDTGTAQKLTGSEYSADLFAESNLTPLGQELIRLLRRPRATLIDLGCGGEQSQIPKLIAQNIGVDYMGVDTYDGFVERAIQLPEGNRQTYIKEDILLFLAQIKKIDAPVFYLSGIELSSFALLREASQAYADACVEEMRRLGGAVVLGPATNFFDPERHGYQQTASQQTENRAGLGNGMDLKHRLYELPTE